jgi:hypothetical protein
MGDWQVSHGNKISEKDKTIADSPKKMKQKKWLVAKLLQQQIANHTTNTKVLGVLTSS